MSLENEYLRVLDYYTSEGMPEQGASAANNWKKQALQKVQETK